MANELSLTNQGLYEHQIPDVAKSLEILKNMPFLLNANRPGYGKTIEALVTAKLMGWNKILIVCPKSIVLQWKDQVMKWLGYSEDQIITEKYSLSTLRKSETKVVIVKYDTLAAGCMKQRGREKVFETTWLIDMLKSIGWDCIIADEVHRIKNRKTARSHALKALPARYRMGLTGTPILRHPDDLYSILDWLGLELNGYWKFCYKYCNITFNGFGKAPDGLTKNQESVEELKKLLESFTVRNPAITFGKGKQVNVVKLEMYPAQRKLYEQIKELILEELPEDCTIFNGMMRSLRLRQVCSNPALFESKYKNPKIDYLKDVLDIDDELKYVVFTYFAETAKQIAKECKSAKPVLFIGSKDERERAEAKSHFIRGDSRLLIGTIGAMSEGVDGLQEVCYNGIFFDRDYNPGPNEQAEERLHREGQAGLVNITYLECEKSIDQKVGKINLKKLKSIRELFI